MFCCLGSFLCWGYLCGPDSGCCTPRRWLENQEHQGGGVFNLWWTCSAEKGSEKDLKVTT